MSETILARWIEDRESLSDEDAAELLRALESDPELARQAKDQLIADDLLSRRLAQDRRNFENQVAQRLLIAGRGEPFLESTLKAIDRTERRRASLRRWAGEAAAAALLLGGLFLLLLRREPAVTPAAPAPGKPGLAADYYPGRSFQGSATRRVDPAVDFSWAAGAGPLAGAGDIYSVRWTGKLRPKVSGPHTFRVRNDDGVRIWIDRKPVIDDWNARLYISESRATVTLDAGKLHEIRVEYYNSGDRGLVQLFWSAPDLPEEIVPAAQFSH